MSLASIIAMEYFYRRREKPTIQRIILTAAAGQTTTLIAAPGAGLRIIVWDGVVTSTGAGAHQWYHTAVDNANRISGPMSQGNNSYERVGPFILPLNTPLLVTATTTAANGWLAYSIAEDGAP